MRMDKADQYRLNRQMLTRFVGWQIGVTLVFGFVSGRLGDIESVRSALAGGAIGVVTNLYMARSFLRGRGETSPGRLLGALYVSEALFQQIGDLGRRFKSQLRIFRHQAINNST